MKKPVASNTITPHNSLLKGGRPYTCRFVHRNPLSTGGRKNEYVYSFINKTGHKYYIYCVEYNIGVFAVKFCLNTERKNPNRYKTVTNFGDGIPVLKTVVSAMLDVLYNRNQSASFAFIGMPREGEQTELTTRYCVYREFCKRYFNPASFDHLYDENSSFYAILNKKSNNHRIQKDLELIAAEELKSEQQTSRPVSLGRSVARA